MDPEEEERLAREAGGVPVEDEEEIARAAGGVPEGPTEAPGPISEVRDRAHPRQGRVIEVDPIDIQGRVPVDRAALARANARMAESDTPAAPPAPGPARPGALDGIRRILQERESGLRAGLIRAPLAVGEVAQSVLDVPRERARAAGMPEEALGARPMIPGLEALRARADALQAEHPVMAGVGDVATLAAAPLPAGPAGAGWLPRLGRVATGAATGAGLSAAMERDPAQRGHAATVGGLLGAGGSAVGEAFSALRPAAGRFADRAYETVASGGYAQAAREAGDVGREKFGEIARRLRLGRFFGGGAQHAQRVENEVGQRVGALAEELPPVGMGSTARHFLERDADLAQQGFAAERENAVSRMGRQALPRNLRERIAAEIAARDAEPLLAAGAGTEAGRALARPVSIGRILRETAETNPEIPFERARQSRHNLGERLFRHRVNSEGGSVAEGERAYGALSGEMQSVADRAGRGDAWRRANEEYRVATISRQGQQARAVHSGTATLAGIRGFTPIGIAQTLANRGSHRIVLSFADLLHAAVRAGAPGARALGVYGPAFQRMQQQHGDTGVSVEHYRRATTDPAYSAATSEGEDER